MISHDDAMCDNVAHNATTNSHRHRPGFPYHGRMPVTARLKALRESARPKISIRAMAEELELPSSTYAAYEDPKKYKKPILPLDLAKKIADVLEKRLVLRDEILKLAGVDGSLSVSAPAAVEKIWVIGRVAAGVWRESYEWAEEERYEIEVGPSPWPGVPRAALEVEGFSMDKLFLPGTVLEYLKLVGNRVGLRAQPGDLVIVQRREGSLHETTCKRLSVTEDGVFRLIAESTRAEFQEPIIIGMPDEEHYGDNDVEIIGVVVRSYYNHFRRGA